MKRLIIAFCLLFLSAPVHALTLKKGQVIGGDGAVYDGASPEQKSQLIKNAQKEDFFWEQEICWCRWWQSICYR